MGVVRDISGMRFGKLEAIERVGSDKHRHSTWLCKCDCGNEIVVRSDSLIRGLQVSCGCYNIEQIRNRSITHGKANTRLYNIWRGIKKRCFVESEVFYKDYGGRGITICDEWKDDFEMFYEWSMQNGYREDLTIDRIDVNGNYEPTNCRWATLIEQQNNTRKNRFLTFNGERHTIAEWSRVTGISVQRKSHRLNGLGMSVERALTEKVRGR